MGSKPQQPIASRVLQRAKDLRNGWNRFWYLPEDPAAVSCLRIATGCVFLYSLLVWSLDIRAFFSQQSGWQAKSLVEELQQGQWTLSFWWLVPDSLIGLTHFASIVITVLFTFGFATRYTKFAVLVISISYANRVPMAGFGLDQIVNAWLLYLCFAPCGARWSIDHWLSLRRNPNTPVHRSASARLGIRLIQVHLCLVYGWAGISKIQGHSWASGEALWWIASNYEHQQVSMTWLAYVPWIYQLLTVGTWIWELSFPFLIWNRKTRFPLLCVGLSMHFGIGLFLGLWPFSLIMISGYVVFLPQSRIRQAVAIVFQRRSRKNAHKTQSVTIDPPSELETFPQIPTDTEVDTDRIEVDAPSTEELTVTIEGNPSAEKDKDTVAQAPAADSVDLVAAAEATVAEQLAAAEEEIEPTTIELPVLTDAGVDLPFPQLVEESAAHSGEQDQGSIESENQDSGEKLETSESVESEKAPDTATHGADPTDNQELDAKPTSTQRKIMLADTDRDNLVIFVERSAKRRCSMIRALEDNGYRCIGVDAWPETIQVYNALKPRSLLCNGYRMPTSELRFWRSQLDEPANSRFIVLAQPHHIEQIHASCENVLTIPIPASFEQICQALTDDDGSAGQGAFGTGPVKMDDEDENGDQIFSMTS